MPFRSGNVRSSRNRHGAHHRQRCERLIQRNRPGEIPSHAASLAGTRQNHARRSGSQKWWQEQGMAQASRLGLRSHRAPRFRSGLRP